MTYKAQLKDQRWKDVRAIIIDRDGKCANCDAVHKLEVHHLYYESGLMAWEYPHDSLRTLCRSCHEIETRSLDELSKALFMELRKKGYTSLELDLLKQIDVGTIDLATYLGQLRKNDLLAVQQLVESLTFKNG